MPPKPRFSFEQVCQAAFVVVREKGWSALSARTIAARLRSSTMPIYSYLKSMVQLEREVRRLAVNVLFDFQARPLTENHYLNMALGYVLFAQEEPRLFRFLFTDRPQHVSPRDQREMKQAVAARLGHDLPSPIVFGRLDAESMDAVTIKSWVFTHGLAIAVCNGLLGPLDQKELARLLSEAGGAFVTWEQKNRRNRGD